MSAPRVAPGAEQHRVRRAGLAATASPSVRGTDGARLLVVALDGGDVADQRRSGPALGREAAALAALPPSPAVVPVLDAGVLPDGRPWWSEPATEPLAPVLPLTLPEALDVAVAVADALAVLHSGGHLHGPVDDDDVRRRDGLVALAGAHLPALADLGLEVAPHLQPPEVHAGGGWSVAADVWALAALVWRLLHGRPHATDLLTAVQGSLPAPRDDLPPSVQVGLLAGLAPDPAARPAGPAALVALLRPEADVRETLPPGAGPEPVGRPLGSGYLLTERLGRGSTGQVFRGVRRRDGAPVAVKLLRPELAEDPETVVRFLRERTVLVGVSAPGVVRVLDLVAEEGVLAVVMELVDGPDLRRVLADSPPPPERALGLLAEVAAALAAVHAAGVVHRDLKPENVLVDPGGAARLSDFGIARAVGAPALTRLSAIVGTPEYLAPEIAAGREAGPASDVYSLGVLGYELLTGSRPFEAPHPAALLRAHLEDAPSRPPHLPDAVWDALARCLAKAPEDRPAAAELARALPALQPALRGQPVPAPLLRPAVAAAGEPLETAAATAPAPAAPPPPPPSRAAWARRRALVLASAGAVLLAGAAGWYAARPDPPAPPTAPATEQALVPLQVFADPQPAGTVRLRFDGSQVEGLQGFVVLQDGVPVTDGLPRDRSEHLATPGDTEEHCWSVLAVAEVPVPAPEPQGDPPRACERALP